MRTAKEVLNEIKWTDGKDLKECEIFYLHRGAPGDFKTMNGGDIIDLGRSFITLNEGKIPYHRVFKIVHKGDTVLSRKRS